MPWGRCPPIKAKTIRLTVEIPTEVYELATRVAVTEGVPLDLFAAQALRFEADSSSPPWLDETGELQNLFNKSCLAIEEQFAPVLAELHARRGAEKSHL